MYYYFITKENERRCVFIGGYPLSSPPTGQCEMLLGFPPNLEPVGSASVLCQNQAMFAEVYAPSVEDLEMEEVADLDLAFCRDRSIPSKKV